MLQCFRVLPQTTIHSLITRVNNANPSSEFTATKFVFKFQTSTNLNGKQQPCQHIPLVKTVVFSNKSFHLRECREKKKGYRTITQ